jgi:hypothetical protein
VKLPAHRAGLPGNEISFLIVPLDPAYKAGLAGHLPAMAGRTDGQMISIVALKRLSGHGLGEHRGEMPTKLGCIERGIKRFEKKEVM